MNGTNAASSTQLEWLEGKAYLNIRTFVARTYLLLIRVVELLLGNSLHSLGELGVCSGVRGARGDREHRLVRFTRPVILCFGRVGGEPRSVELVVVAESRKGIRVTKSGNSTPSRRRVK